MSPQHNSIRVRYRSFKNKTELINLSGMEKDAEKLMRKHLWKVLDVVQPYPPPKPGSSYVRTRRLFKGWKTNVRWTKEGLVGSIYNTAWYAPRVQGPRQWSMHKQTGWLRLQDYLFRDEFHAAVRKFGRDLLRRSI